MQIPGDCHSGRIGKTMVFLSILKGCRPDVFIFVKLFSKFEKHYDVALEQQKMYKAKLADIEKLM
jgi:hypothetical protein